MIKKHKLKRDAIPEVLKTIPSPPKELFVIGDLSKLLQLPRLTIVGTRKITPYGKEITERFAREAASAGVVIVSGLALGVDAAAHKAALSVGGLTIAVLPSGLDHIYPRTHVQLAKEIIAKGGALVSEYPDGTAPFRSNFIARNRLVAGLGDALLVTEAAGKSGTLHTVNFALQHGKTVMAVPGNITNPQSEGTNNLIKSGALPVTLPEEVLEILHVDIEDPTNEIMAGSLEEQVILTLLVQGISDGHALLVQSKLSPAIFNQTLTMLEITGRVRPLGNNHWSKI